MSWKGSIVDQRHEFVALAQQEGVNRRDLCRRFGISPQTGYKWLGRVTEELESWSRDRSRRPLHSPGRSSDDLESAVLAVRRAHPAWGARKIAWTLEQQGVDAPACSTIHAVLQRHGCIVPREARAKATGRFEHPAPNLVWQMDFKGRFDMVGGRYCHPLTIVDDHSRYAVCLEACDNETTDTVKRRLISTFHRYGLPEVFLVDNGSPWGGSDHRTWTQLGVWLLKLGIGVIHSRPYHPQTRGKNERFHRTLIDEVLALKRFRSIPEVQRAFDAWRPGYNTIRPHEGIGMNPPASRYQPSARKMPDRIMPIEYADTEIVRTVARTKSYFAFKGRMWKVPQAFQGERVAIRPTEKDATYGVFFGAHKITEINLKNVDQ